MTAMTTIKDWQDSYFTSVKRIEVPVVRVAGQVSDAVAKFVPERPSFLASLPTTAELVETQLKFRKRFVDEQAAFVRSMLKAMNPVFTKFDTVAKPVAKPAAKATTKPTAVRKAA